MYALIMVGLFLTASQATPKPQPPIQELIEIPPAQNELNAMFVASKGNRKYKILSLPAFQKELDKCIMIHVEFFDTERGPLIVFRCEESQ